MMRELNRPSGDELAGLARRFAYNAAIYRSGGPEDRSPLYEHLAQAVADDPDVLGLVVGVDRYQQVSHLLFGAVHFLLLSGIQHPLAHFYASLSEAPRPPQEAYHYFRAFCVEHVEAIHGLVTTQRVQTNEVLRCSGLLPAFGEVSRRAGGRPLAVVELGASAGLNLLWDAYRYDYGAAGSAGDARSPVELRCAPRGVQAPPLPDPAPEVAYRVGIDIRPIDVHDTTATRWLRALIWPEHADRARLLEQALEVARRDPPPLIEGDLLDLLPALLARAPQDATPCVYHSYTLNQCPPEAREWLDDLLAVASAERESFRVSLEWYRGQEHPQLELYRYHQGIIQRDLLAYCESHGRWIEWLQR